MWTANHAYMFSTYRSSVLAIIVSLTPVGTYAQIGGNNTYESLNLVTSARASGLGGQVLAIKDDDIDMAWYNPSLLNENMHNHLVVNFVDYLTDIKLVSSIYSFTHEKFGSFSGGIQYMHFGTFQEYNETGTFLREFTAQDIVVNLGWGTAIAPKINVGTAKERTLDSMFYVGANFKFINSSYHFDYSSFGVAVDLAGTYHNRKRDFVVAMVIKNIGVQIKPFTPDNREPLPFEIQAGITKKLKHAPFRLMLHAQHLEKWDLTYVNPNAISNTFDPAEKDTLFLQKVGSSISGFTDKLLRHAIIGTELVITQNFHIRLGYNYLKRKELKSVTKKGTAGFSIGVGLKISKFNFSYSRSSFHLAGGSNQFTIRTSLSEFKSKPKDPEGIPQIN